MKAHGLSHIMRSHHNRLIILKTALPDKIGYARLNTWAMGDKGGQSVVKIHTEMRPECLGGNATRDLFAIDNREKRENPSDGIIGFTRGEC
jgi:hypothetical protein